MQKGVSVERCRHTGAEGRQAHLGLVRLHATQVAQVGLVAHKHDGRVGVRVLAQLLQPPLDVLKRHCTLPSFSARVSRDRRYLMSAWRGTMQGNSCGILPLWLAAGWTPHCCRRCGAQVPH